MARSRNIKPGFFSNDVLAECNPLARILFAGLWTIADRAGRLEERPRRIKADLLPYDECDVAVLLEQLASRGFIIRYSVAGKAFIQIDTWEKHQNPHMKEAASEIPEPDEHSAGPVQTQGDTRPKPERAGLIPDSLILIPDSPIQVGGGEPAKPTKAGEVHRAAEAGTAKAADAAAARAARLAAAAADDDALFEEFWKAYPKKVGKDEARKAFDKRNPTTALVGAMVEAVATARATDQWKREKGQFIPNPATWLNQGRWKDGGVEISDDVAVDPDSRSAVEAEGVAKGIGMWDELFEHWGSYKARVRARSAVSA